MLSVFSFCLYGPENPRYYPGLLENIDLIKTYFPDWKVYVYVAPDVDQSMIDTLSRTPSVVLRMTGVTGPINMIHRFYAIDEPQVDLMMVRDADSRVHWKDRWAIRQFVANAQYVAHTIRDNVEHTAEMMGGLWGIRKSAGVSIRAKYGAYTGDNGKGARNGHDQNFLSDMIYPEIVTRLLVHYSNKRLIVGETAVEFPFDWTNETFCGRIETMGYRDVPDPHTPNRGLTISVPGLSSAHIRSTYVPPIIQFLHRK